MQGMRAVLMRVHKQPFTPWRLLRPLLWVFVAFYFIYHALHGERGLFAYAREQRELAQLQSELKTTKATREKLELRVSHLRDGSLDLDLLDEQMRRMLGVMKPGEVVVMTGVDD